MRCNKLFRIIDVFLKKEQFSPFERNITFFQGPLNMIYVNLITKNEKLQLNKLINPDLIQMVYENKNRFQYDSNLGTYGDGYRQKNKIDVSDAFGVINESSCLGGYSVQPDKGGN